MPQQGTPELRLDQGRRDGGTEIARTAALEDVLDALPSPTVLLAADGTVLLANSAWTTRNDAVDPGMPGLGVGQNYFATALSLPDPTAIAVVESLRALSRGEWARIAVDCAVPGRDGVRWLHLQASRIDATGSLVVTHTDITARVQAERASAWQARHDHLTELPNRAHLHELIDQAVLHDPGERTRV